MYFDVHLDRRLFQIYYAQAVTKRLSPVLLAVSYTHLDVYKRQVSVRVYL